MSEYMIEAALFYCYAPSTCVSLRYANKVFENLKINLSNYADMIIEIANFNEEAAEKAERIKETCAGRGIKKLMLGGWCNGGLEAIRISQILDTDGIRLLPVILFDTYEPGYWAEHGESEEISMKESLTLFYQQMIPDDDFDLYRALGELQVSDMPRYVVDRIAGTGYSKENAERMLRKYNKVRNDLVRHKGNVSIGKYSYKGDLLLFSAMDEITPDIDRYLGWRRYFEPELVELRANHFTMFSHTCLEIIVNKMRELFIHY